MPFTLAYLDSPVPGIPAEPGSNRAARPPDHREHFGTEDAARRRAAVLLPGPAWLDLRLYGPDGRLIAGPERLAAELGAATVQQDAADAAGEGHPS